MRKRAVKMWVAALMLAGSPLLLGGCSNYVSPCTKVAPPPKAVIDAVAINGYGLEVNVDQNGTVVPEAQADEGSDTVECDLVVSGSRTYWSEEAEASA